MATVTYIPEHKQSPSALRGVIEYCQQKIKTYDSESRRDLISGIGCDGRNAYEEFMLTKQAFGKMTGINFYQYTQSFDSVKTISSVDAHALALEFAERAWPGHEVLICTHCDSDNPHTHFVINSVSYVDGHKLRQSPHTLEQLRKISDEICIAHGLSVLMPDAQKTVKGMSAWEYRSADKGQSWKFQLMCAIDDSMKRTWTQEEFIEQMHRLGYEVRWTEERANITYTVPGGMKCRDYKLHQDKYLKENMKNEFAYREEIHRRAKSAAQPLSGGGERGGTVFLGVGEELERSTEPTLRNVFTAARNTGGTRSASDETGCAGDAGSDQQKHTDAASASPGSDGSVFTTGWEHERKILFSRRWPGLGYGKSAPPDRELDGKKYAGYVQQNRFGTQESGSYSPEMAGRVGPGMYRGGAVGGGALLRGHPAAAGVGTAVGALAALDGDDSDDPEEQRRRIEARESAQNLGAMIGLVAGAAIGIAEKNRIEDQQKEEQPEMQQSM